MSWWKILKNAKVSGKAKGEGVGTSFDASKIKINIDKNNCKEELKRILSNALDIAPPKKTTQLGNPSKWLHTKWIDDKLSEKRACDFIKSLKFKLPLIKEDMEMEEYKKYYVGSHQFKNDRIAITRETIFERPKTRKAGYTVFLIAKSENDDIFDTFAGFTFATNEEYNKWVKSI